MDGETTRNPIDFCVFRSEQPLITPIIKMAELLLDPQDGLTGRRAVTDELLLARALIDQIPDFLFVKDLESRFLLANAALSSTYGFTDRDDIIGKTDFDLHGHSAADAFFAIEQRIMTTGETIADMEESFADSNGVWHWYSTTKMPLRDSNARIVGLVGVGRDITERKQMERYRQEQGVLLEMIAKNEPLPSVLDRLALFTESQLDGIRTSILLFDKETDELRAGAAPSMPAGYGAMVNGVRIGPRAGSCGTAAFRRETVITPDIDIDPLWEDFRALAKGAEVRACWSTPILDHDGGVLGTFAMYADTVRVPTPAETLLIDVATRIAGIAIQRQQSEDRIKFIAHHDALTSLPNRTQLSDRLVRAIQCAQDGSGRVSVVFIDLDDFKIINDGLGHKAGDHLLRTLALRMLEGTHQHDSVIRLGGDEFVLILVERAGEEAVTIEKLEWINAAICRPVEVDGHVVRVTCSMGVAVYPQDALDPETLLINADAAMYSAKDHGRNNYQFYTASMNAEKRARLELQEIMRDAIARAEMHLVYQPQVDLGTGRIFAVEALLRWYNPMLGLIPPSRFVPIAEESGLIVPIGDWVLQTACAQHKAWQDAGIEPVTMSVNVSARQFMHRDWAEKVKSALHGSGMAARYLDLEMTESMLMSNVSQAVEIMCELRDLGVCLSIDDFGTGYSSLSALKSFPVGRLKIDQSFVRDLSSSENDRAIASAIISMGHSLGLRVIAEGVETPEQLAFLTKQGCDEVQGYYFGKPVRPREIRDLLMRQEPLIAPSRTRSATPARTALAC